MKLLAQVALIGGAVIAATVGGYEALGWFMAGGLLVVVRLFAGLRDG